MRGGRIDITGNKYNKLTVIEFSHSKNHRAYWKCLCECGNEKIVRGDGLKNGNDKSCGCLNKEPTRVTHNMTNTKIYRVWASMKNRCLNPNDSNYHIYGGKGVTLYSEWINFEPFYEWCMSSGYKEGLSIDRINVEGGYEPINCRWITMKEQQHNKSTNIVLTYENKSLNISQWAKELNVTYNLLYRRLRKFNYDIEKAINSLK